jgi:arginine exporter protein ArgO
VKPRIYIDTSVFGGNFGKEFKENTISLFEGINRGSLSYFIPR